MVLENERKGAPPASAPYKGMLQNCNQSNVFHSTLISNSATLGKIRVVAWNSNGLTPTRRLEMCRFLDFYQVDICLVSETHFTKESFMRVGGYDSYWVNHPSDNSRGGVALLIRNGLSHYLDLQWQTPSIQSVSVTLKTEIGQIRVASI